MRRQARVLGFIAVIVVLSGLILGFQRIHIGGFERGGDTPLGLKLGLDLQGGIHLVYQTDITDPVTGESVPPTRDQMNALKATIERRVNRSGLGEPIILLLGADRLLVQLPGVEDLVRAKTLVGETARLEFKHRTFNVSQEIAGLSPYDILAVDIRAETTATATPVTGQAPEPTPETAPGPIPEATPGAVEGAGDALAGGTNATATPELIVTFTPQGAAAFAAAVAGLQASLELGPGATYLYPDVLSVSLDGLTQQTLQVPYLPLIQVPDGPVLPVGDTPMVRRIEGTDSFAIAMWGVASTVAEARQLFGNDIQVKMTEVLGKVDGDIGLTGDDLARAYAGQHQSSGAPIVNIEFKDRGARVFGELTAKIAGTSDEIAILLDGEELIAPTVRTAITGGAAYIQGKDFTMERVRDIALLLESGRLPVPIGEPILERKVGPTLGAESLRKSVVAGLVGLALILVFIVAYYRAPGLVAGLALVIYAAVLLAIFKIVPVTLTLAGVAATILSIGMAVDANILIFERMKEELRIGRTLTSAINLGFDRAWPAIRDSNASTLITCAILFWFSDQLGATLVKGFAITLAVGVGLSMFSAITVSRTFLRLLSQTPLGRRTELFVPAGRADLPQGQGTPAVQRS